MTNKETTELAFKTASTLIGLAFELNLNRDLDGRGCRATFEAARRVLADAGEDGDAIVEAACEGGEYTVEDLKSYRPCSEIAAGMSDELRDEVLSLEALGTMPMVPLELHDMGVCEHVDTLLGRGSKLTDFGKLVVAEIRKKSPNNDFQEVVRAIAPHVVGSPAEIVENLWEHTEDWERLVPPGDDEDTARRMSEMASKLANAIYDYHQKSAIPAH